MDGLIVLVFLSIVQILPDPIRRSDLVDDEEHRLKLRPMNRNQIENRRVQTAR